MEKKKKKKQKWTKFRHKVVTVILRYTLGIYTKLKYNIRVDKFREQEKRPYLILFNHQTAFDQFFVGMSFKGPIYYVASEDLFSNGFTSSLIKWLVAPIPIKKQTTDVRAVLNCMHVAREGGTIAIAPEGNRTFDGKQVHINPTVTQLAKKLAMPIVLYKIEGGYGVQPRWSDVVRRGKMHAYVSRVIYPEEFADMTDEELLREIKEGLRVDEAKVDGQYRHKNLAEYLERALYVCPKCGLTELRSEGDIIECKKCSMKVRYLPTRQLRGVGFDFPFEFVSDWYDHQCNLVNSLDLTSMTETPVFTDEASISEVIVYKSKIKLCENAKISLFGDRIEISGGAFTLSARFDEISTITVLGKNKLNVYHGGKIYQIKGSKRFNALKYVNFCYRYQNIKKGENDVKFLGL
ncbi:MAG: 1-acyl-sn-glycerol-3-phosphate acyltransferase [Ruminococcaceae bacterium]|nr:1-acyl-sn-glycerol-3-phosphate acyltransferase [Oscillospiraceae bacterium]